jgi:hypothetical protein
VTDIASWSQKSFGNEVKLCVLNSRLECMLWVVAVLHTNMARNAEIKVRASSAGDKVLLGEFWKGRQ